MYTPRKEFVKYPTCSLKDLQFISSCNRFCLLCKITYASYETGHNNNIFTVQYKQTSSVIISARTT